MRGQLSIEFIVIMSGMLIIIAAITMPIYNQARADAERVSKLADAREAANTLANAINMVYSAGVGSRQTVEYWLPSGVISISFVNGARDRVDVKIELDLESDNLVQVNTILPSRSDENRVMFYNENFNVYSGFHRMTFTYRYSNNLRYIEIKEA